MNSIHNPGSWLLDSGSFLETVTEARRRSLELISDLSDEQLIGPRLAIVNPLQWEIGHVAWFQERWILRHAAGQNPRRPDADDLYDSAQILHDTRWDVILPSRSETLEYVKNIGDRVLTLLSQGKISDEIAYFVRLTVFHEDMHDEAFTYTRQTLGYPPPRFWSHPCFPSVEAGPLPGDVIIPGGTFMFGAAAELPFVFDNEKWAHPVEVGSFAIARAAVTQDEFREMVDDGGYQRKELWSEAGWRWREQAGTPHPVCWRPTPGGSWQRRDFDRWVSLEPHRPVLHVNWFEADAFCRWAGRRLPTEAEWEMAASAEPTPDGRGISERKRHFPWGDSPPTPERANLDWRAMGCLDVGALSAGDSAFGCRQMIGNVWEWTESDFVPFPGFVADPYREYSEPWFGTHKVLRGGCWVTRSRLIRNTWRNFYRPERSDVWAGFRTCAL
jgi:iron(II)-dependent oxidoreductase